MTRVPALVKLDLEDVPASAAAKDAVSEALAKSKAAPLSAPTCCPVLFLSCVALWVS